MQLLFLFLDQTWNYSYTILSKRHSATEDWFHRQNKKNIYIHINQHYLQVYPILSILKTKWGTVLCRKWAGNRPFCLCQSKNYYRPYAPRLALSQNGHHFVYTLYLKMCKVFQKEYLRLSPKSEKEHVSFFWAKKGIPGMPIRNLGVFIF